MRRASSPAAATATGFLLRPARNWRPTIPVTTKSATSTPTMSQVLLRPGLLAGFEFNRLVCVPCHRAA